MSMLMKAARIGATQEHGGVARFWLRLPEDARSNFEKIKSKITQESFEYGVLMEKVVGVAFVKQVSLQP
jgi:hypothetical protein